MKDEEKEEGASRTAGGDGGGGWERGNGSTLGGFPTEGEHSS
jgi:hypothetical protein